MEQARNIILFDGQCNLCNSSVKFIIKRDAGGVFKFASLQSSVGKALLAQVGMVDERLRSFVYIEDGTAYTKSDAALRVAKKLSYPTKLLAVFIIVPKFIRDFVYNLVARNRYRIFGKANTCMMPTKELQARFQI